MSGKDSAAYERFVRICKKHLRWLGLSGASRDVLTVLLLENYWSGKPLSPEEICSLTGFSRSSVSVIISQLEVIGIVDGHIDSSQTGRGRRRTLYSVSGGLSSLTLFGIKRIAVELQDLIDDVESITPDDKKMKAVFTDLRDEASGNLTNLIGCAREVNTRQAKSKIRTNLQS